MKRIQKAWEINLTFPKDDQFKSKEEIADKCCPNDKTMKVEKDIISCIGYCDECWNKEIINPIDTEIHNEDKTLETEDSSELTFDSLEYWKRFNDNEDEEIYITSEDEKELIDYIKSDKSIVCLSTYLTLDEIPLAISHLQKVYKYCTKLKNKVEYVDFQTAFKHMKDGGQIRHGNYVYKIENDKLKYSCEWNKDCFEPCDAFTFKEINSNEWVLLL